MNGDEQISRRENRITVDPAVCGGRPCIRGMRIRVIDIIDQLAAGASHAEILASYPYFEEDDLRSALAYAADAVGHRVIRAA